MKSNERVDREIHALAKIWNNNTTPEDRDPGSRNNQLFAAIYHTLRWARGSHHEQTPSELLLWYLARSAHARPPQPTPTAEGSTDLSSSSDPHPILIELLRRNKKSGTNSTQDHSS